MFWSKKEEPVAPAPPAAVAGTPFGSASEFARALRLSARDYVLETSWGNCYLDGLVSSELHAMPDPIAVVVYGHDIEKQSAIGRALWLVEDKHFAHITRSHGWRIYLAGLAHLEGMGQRDLDELELTGILLAGPPRVGGIQWRRTCRVVSEGDLFVMKIVPLVVLYEAAPPSVYDISPGEDRCC
jgi:hypothetical protein